MKKCVITFLKRKSNSDDRVVASEIEILLKDDEELSIAYTYIPVFDEVKNDD